MLILLPPSETKAVGGDRTPLDLPSLSFPELTSTRELLLDTLIETCTDVTAARALIGVPASKDPELEANTRLRSAPTLPAVRRYTGVLYDALDIAGMTRVQRAKAEAKLAVCSALFGLVRAGDRIPAYRFSAGSKLPGLPTTAAVWREVIPSVAAAQVGAVVDLRSGGYAAFGPFPGAITARVVTVTPSGQRQVVSHFNKHTKGLLARALTITRADVTDISGVIAVARRAGLRTERVGDTEIEITSAARSQTNETPF